jgi:triosephosphate isomerase
VRKPIIAGNWKMHKTIDESIAFVKELAPKVADYEGVDKVVAPTFIALQGVSQALEGSTVGVSSQQIHWEDKGAFTSQISPVMLQGMVQYAIIGHSECRAYLNETDETVNKKAKAALANGIQPIIAVGESLEQNEAGETADFVSGQVRAGLEGITAEQMANVILAYEPIWAIGTGKNASSAVANDIIGGVIRKTLRELYGDAVAEQTRIQYGGSVKPNNMAEYMAQPDIDGALVGGASLDVDSFAEMIRIAQETKGE